MTSDQKSTGIETKSLTRGTTAVPSEHVSEFSIARSAEVTGTFTIHGVSKSMFDSFRTNRTIAITMDHQWTRLQRFLNKFLRLMLWPVGPKHLPKSYSYEFPNAEITRVNVSDLGTYKVTTVDFRVPNENL